MIELLAKIFLTREQRDVAKNLRGRCVRVKFTETGYIIEDKTNRP